MIEWQRGGTKMRIAICDDEPMDADNLKILAEYYFNQLCRVDTFYSGAALLRKRTNYDVFFLDISMEDISGLEIAEKIREDDMRAMIVFVTNYEDYYRCAFSVHAFDYMVKPINKEKVFKTLGEIRRYKQEDRQNRQINVKGADGNVKIIANQVCYFEYFDRKIKVVLDDDVIWIKGTMKKIRETMEKLDFVMVHKAYVINMRKIKVARRFEIVMLNGDVVPIAQKRAAGFKKKFELYLYDQV
jgi:Response regulator of the LytR/AlgR family